MGRVLLRWLARRYLTVVMLSYVAARPVPRHWRFLAWLFLLDEEP